MNNCISVLVSRPEGLRSKRKRLGSDETKFAIKRRITTTSGNPNILITFHFKANKVQLVHILYVPHFVKYYFKHPFEGSRLLFSEMFSWMLLIIRVVAAFSALTSLYYS